MSEIAVDLKAKDQMSQVLDHVAQRFGVLNKAGLSMGIAFSGINFAIAGLQQAIGAVIQYVKDGIEANRQFEMSMARLSMSSSNLDVSMSSLKDTLVNYSVIFATNLNTLTQGLQTFIRTGYNASDSTKLLFHAEMLAVTSGNDLATTQDTLIRTMQEFNLGVGDVNDVVNKLNEISSVTKMPLSEIDTILGRVAITAKESGVSFDNLINIMYTLYTTGTSTRMLASALTEELKNLGNVKIDIMPDSTVTSTEAKFARITSTAEFTAARMAQVGTIMQMNFSKGLDINAFIDETEWNKALKLVEQLGKQGVKTIEDLKLKGAGVELHVPGTAAGLTGFLQDLTRGMTGVNFSDLAQDMQILVAAIIQYNENISEAPGKTTSFTNNLDELTKAAESLRVEMSQLQQNIGDLTSQRAFMIQMHDAAAAVRDQEDAIKSLQRANDALTLSQMKNSLEIAKIQYSAMGERHGLSREQKDVITALEKVNAGIQIQEQEQQIAISEIQQNGLQRAQDQLDAIRMQHDEWMYSTELRDLSKQIADKNALYLADAQNLIDKNALIAAAMQKFHDDLLSETTSWADKMMVQYSRAFGGNGTTGSTGSSSNGGGSSGSTGGEGTSTTPANPISNPGLPPTWSLPHLASGGFIERTGAAVIHQGEMVIPAGNTGSQYTSVKNNYDIDIHVDGAQIHGDVETWGKNLGKGIASGFIEASSSATVEVTTRKGNKAQVPGVSTTIRTGRVPGNSLVVPQPIKHKPRFRVG